jgi:hypothetical protein
LPEENLKVGSPLRLDKCPLFIHNKAKTYYVKIALKNNEEDHPCPT